MVGQPPPERTNINSHVTFTYAIFINANFQGTNVPDLAGDPTNGGANGILLQSLDSNAATSLKAGNGGDGGPPAHSPAIFCNATFRAASFHNTTSGCTARPARDSRQTHPCARDYAHTNSGNDLWARALVWFQKLKDNLKTFRKMNPITFSLTVIATAFAILAVTTAWYSNILAQRAIDLAVNGNDAAWQSLKYAVNGYDMERMSGRIALMQFCATSDSEPCRNVTGWSIDNNTYIGDLVDTLYPDPARDKQALPAIPGSARPDPKSRKLVSSPSGVALISAGTFATVSLAGLAILAM